MLIFIQPQNRDSVLQRLNTSCKLILMILFMVIIFAADNLSSNILLCAYTIFLICIARISMFNLILSIKPIFVLVIITIILHLCFTTGDEIWLSTKYFTVYETGVSQAAQISLKILLFVIVTSLFTLTTSVSELSNTLDVFLRPLQKMGLPSQELALMVSIIFRFMPLVGEETERIKLSQIARGANFKHTSILRKIKSYTSLFIPLLHASFQRTQELAEAMESRCYISGIKRTNAKEVKYEKLDYLALLIHLTVSVVIFLIRG